MGNANNAFLILQQLPYYQFIEFNLTTYVCVNKLLKSVFCSHFNECISVSSNFFSISSVAVYNLKIRKKKRKLTQNQNKTNKQTNSVRKKKEIKKNTYTCRILSMSNNDATFTKKKQGKFVKNLYFCESLKFCNISQ